MTVAVSAAALQPSACFRCNAPIEWLTAGEGHVVPGAAVLFTTHGNYGSRVFDQVHGEQAVLAVCDGCMRAAGHLIRVRKKQHHPDVFDDLGNFFEWEEAENARYARYAELSATTGGVQTPPPNSGGEAGPGSEEGATT